MKKIFKKFGNFCEFLTTPEGFFFLLSMIGLALLTVAAASPSEAVTAMAIVAGAAGGKHVEGEPLTLTASREASPGLLRNEIDRRIVKVRPMATPVDQISRYADARHAGSMVVEYYSVDTKPVEAKIISIAPGVKNERAGITTADVHTDNDDIFEPSETIMVPDVLNKDGGEPLVLYVVEKKIDGFTAIAVNALDDDGNHVFPSIEAGARLIRMGRAAAELDVQTAQFEALPVKADNFCQIFKAQVEQSTYHKIANKEVGWGFSDQEEAAIIDMRMGMEKNFLFGSKCRFFDPVKKNEVMFTGGIWNQIPKEETYINGALDHPTLVHICRLAFTGSGCSSRKILIGGSGFIEQLHNINHTKVIGAETTMTKWGLDFTEIVTKFGRLYVISSEVFDQCGHENDAMIIDPEYLTKYCHVPFHTERLDLRGSGVRNTDAIVLTEASCLVLRYPDAHLRIVSE